jgi:hypothetical protein
MSFARGNISATLPVNMEGIVAPFVGLSDDLMALNINLTLNVIYPYEFWHVEVFGLDASAD